MDEERFNLSLRKLLKQFGFETVLTRPDDAYVGLAEREVHALVPGPHMLKNRDAHESRG